MADLIIVDEGLESSHQAAADLNAVRPMACFARLPTGKIIGGACARTWGECCVLRQLWVAPPFRRRRIGHRFIAMVEEEARHRGCTLLFLEPFRFQVTQLYQSAGLAAACEFQGFPGGIRKYVVRKALARSKEPAEHRQPGL
jgi:GNAT superfamily N-acetyltransferase